MRGFYSIFLFVMFALCFVVTSSVVHADRFVKDEDRPESHWSLMERVNDMKRKAEACHEKRALLHSGRGTPIGRCTNYCSREDIVKNIKENLAQKFISLEKAERTYEAMAKRCEHKFYRVMKAAEGRSEDEYISMRYGLNNLDFKDKIESMYSMCLTGVGTVVESEAECQCIARSTVDSLNQGVTVDIHVDFTRGIAACKGK